jgi:hypothetical protein
MWGKPNERETYIIIHLQESLVQHKNHISSQEKYLTATKIVPKFSSLENVPKSVQLYELL